MVGANAQSNPSQITSNKDLSHSQRIQLGEMDYRTYCAPCHGMTGIGDGPVASELNNAPADLTKLTGGNQLSFDEVKMIVDGRDMPRAHGTSEMPVWGVWFAYEAIADSLHTGDKTPPPEKIDKRIKGLVAFLKSIQE